MDLKAETKLRFKDGYIAGGAWDIAKREGNQRVVRDLEKLYDEEGLRFAFGFCVGATVRMFRGK